jgi:hypothetical protein
MAKDKIFEEFDSKIESDKVHAQVLIEISTHSKTYEEAKKIIEDSGINITKVKHLSSNWVLFELDVKDMRDIALKLTENGFENIKGINATDRTF